VVPLARRYLLTEKIRFLMSIAGVAFSVLLVLVVTSLYRGWSESSAFFNELPGDVWVAQEGTSDPLRSWSFLPIDSVDELERLDGVAVAFKVYSRRVAVPQAGPDVSMHVMSFDGPAGLPIDAADKERFFPAPGSLIVDSVFADDAGLAEGSTLELLHRELTIERIVPGGNPLFALAFANSSDAPELLGLDGYVNFVVLVLDPDASVDRVAAAVAAAVPGSEARTADEYAATMGATVDEGFLPVVGALVAIGLAIGGAVVALTTYTATIEKARDFAVMKALGASSWFVYRVVIRQSAVVAVAGSLIGVAAAALVATFVQRVVPEFVTDIQWIDATTVMVLTVIVALIATYVPVRRINHIDPAMVFRA
jgi:putative ABC transport system permease protein